MKRESRLEKGFGVCVGLFCCVPPRIPEYKFLQYTFIGSEIIDKAHSYSGTGNRLEANLGIFKGRPDAHLLGVDGCVGVYSETASHEEGILGTDMEGVEGRELQKSWSVAEQMTAIEAQFQKGELVPCALVIAEEQTLDRHGTAGTGMVIHCSDVE